MNSNDSKLTVTVCQFGTTWRNAKGEIHRDGDEPAFIRHDGEKSWYKNGKFHRDNGKPAIERASGARECYINGKLNRNDDLPAIEWSNGDKDWYLNDKLHRENGPAAIDVDGTKCWWFHDVCTNCKSQEEFEKYKMLIAFE